MADRQDALRKVVFQQKLGTLADKQAVMVQPSEVLALVVAEDLLEPLQQAPVAKSLADLRDRLGASLTPEGQAWVDELRRTVFAAVPGAVRMDGREEALDAIEHALAHEQRLRIVYDSPEKGRTERVVDPYALALFPGRAYLHAVCHRAGEVRQFALQRIQSATVLDETFERSPEVDVELRSRKGFGVCRGQEFAFAFELAPSVAHVARERRFHDTQVLEEAGSGWVRVRFTCAGLSEVAAWLAGYGGLVRALEPPELRDAVRRLHEEGLERLREGDGGR